MRDHALKELGHTEADCLVSVLLPEHPPSPLS